MADEKIRKSDIIEDGILDEAIKTGEEYNKILDKQTKLLEKNAMAHKEVAKQANLSAKGLKEVDKAERETIKLQQESERVTREKIKNEQEIEKLRKLKIQTTQQEIRLGQQQKKIRDRNNKALKTEENAYKRLSKRLTDTRNKYKDLLAQGRGNEKATRDLGREVTMLDKKLKSIDAQAGQFQRNVGNYPKTLGKVQASFRNLIGVVGQFGVALGGVAIARDAFSVILDFDQAIANLKAISGATESELKLLSNQAKELGSSTSFTASEVAGLQTELAKLGFNPQQITAQTESILQLAKATGADLSEAAALSGSTLRAFNLDASEAARVNSVLAVSTTKTALDFNKLNTALSTVAPVANSLGFSLEDTTALLGQLSNAGFDASSSATATRNILLNLADSNGDLAKALGRPVKSAADLADGLQELNDKGIDLAAALELTDNRSVAAFSTFLQGAEELKPLVSELTDVEDELRKIAETQDNTLRGSLDRLRSAWEGYILGTGEATGASERLRAVIDFLAENLDTILDFLLRAVRAFAVLRTTVFLTTKVFLPLNAALKVMASNFGKSGKGIKGATVAFKGLNTAMKANIIGLVAAAVIELVDALDLFTSQAEKTQEAIEGIRKKEEENRAQVLENTDKVLKGINDRRQEAFDNIDRERDELLAAANTDKERLEIQKKFNQQKQDLIKADKELLNIEIESAKVFAERRKKSEVGAREEAKIREDAKRFEEELGKITGGNGSKKIDLEDRLAERKKQIAQLDEINATRDAEIAKLKELQNMLDKESLNLASKGKILDIEKGKRQKKFVENKKTEINIEKELLKLRIRSIQSDDERIKLRRELADLEARERLERIRDERKKNGEFLRSKEERERIQELLDITITLNRVEAERAQRKLSAQRIAELDAEVEKLNELKEQFLDIEAEVVTQGLDKDIELLDRRIAKLNENIRTAEDLAELNRAEGERAELQAAQVSILAQRQKEAVTEQIRLEKQKLRLVLLEIDQRLRLESISETERQQLVNKQKIINDQLVQLEKNKNAEIIKIEQDAANQIETFRNQANEKQLKNTEDFKKKQVEQYKELAKTIENIFQKILEAIERNIDRQIELTDKQIAANQKRQDELLNIAINGRGKIAEDAKKSLAEEEAREAQAQAKRAQLEKRKQQLEKVSIILKNIGNLVEQGLTIEQATAKSFSSVQIIETLLSAFEGFYDGTDDTGKAKNPLDGKGGRMAILHDNEQVWSKKDRAKVGFKTRDEVIEAAQDGWRLAEEVGKYQTLLGDVQNLGGLNTEVVQAAAFDTTNLENRMKDVESAIKGLKFPESGAGKITSEFFKWLDKDGKGNTSEYVIRRPKL